MEELFDKLFRSINDQDEITKIFDSGVSTKDIVDALCSKIDFAEGYAVWNAILGAEDVAVDKIFKVCSLQVAIILIIIMFFS